MSELKLNYTRDEIYADFEDMPFSYEQQLLQDWLSLYDTLADLRQRVREAVGEMKSEYTHQPFWNGGVNMCLAKLRKHGLIDDDPLVRRILDENMDAWKTLAKGDEESEE